MGLLWAALPMAGCAVMMIVMMRMAAMGQRGQDDRATAPERDDGRREALEAEADELRARLADRDTRSS